MTLRVLAAVALAFVTADASAHEMRPSLVELRELGGGEVEVTWKVALAKGRPLDLRLALPEGCVEEGPGVTDTSLTVHSRRFIARCGRAGLEGLPIRVDGLRTSGTDVVARWLADGSVATRILTAAEPSWTIPAKGGLGASVSAYLLLGIEHIAFGPDHLLFVLGLLLVVGRSTRQLLATITAFTVGHSITLVAASLDAVRLPSASVEAVIALSILLLAVEVAAGERANRWRSPWVFALVCGLVHGLGFAGALRDIGLPEDGLLAALFLFNVGVELGQLGFVGIAVLVSSAPGFKSMGTATMRRLAGYALGVPASYWLIQRVLSIFDRSWS